ncbi:MAG: hypothetical protein JWN99_1193 [Ilumatobacteraceae bacterium]|nr:hypothetical protein [Ilumatobacteraceae bacterium]
MSAINDFDFLLGTDWVVHHHKLQQRLADCDTWWDFDGTSTFWKILGGMGNVDDNVIDQPTGSYRGASVRLFDRAADQWSIYWMSDTSTVIEPPVMGRFENGVGVFEGDDTFEGRPISVRFIWSDIAENSAKWDQAFSIDGGASWETNWQMTFERA